MKCHLLLPLLLLATGTHAADSGFLNDYSKLQAADDKVGADRWYVSKGLFDQFGDYRGIYVAPPEFFIAPDSKYKGLSTEDMRVIGDVMREAVSKELRDAGALLLERPQEGSLTLRTAISNMHVEKKKRGLLAYTPVGAVAHGIKGAFEDVMQKVNLKDAMLEVEVVDSASGETLAAATQSSKWAGDKPVGWDRAQAFFSLLGQRIACRLNNARLPAEQRTDCLAIRQASTN